jgi:hypothetical protein
MVCCVNLWADGCYFHLTYSTEVHVLSNRFTGFPSESLQGLQLVIFVERVEWKYRLLYRPSFLEPEKFPESFHSKPDCCRCPSPPRRST